MSAAYPSNPLLPSFPDSFMTSSGAVADTPLDTILEQQSRQLSGSKLHDAQRFAGEFLRRVAADELAARSATDWTALIADMRAFVAVRQANKPKVRVFNPAVADQGFSTSRTLVEVVTDDMPFLVDSVSMAIASAGLRIHSVIHPVLR